MTYRCLQNMPIMDLPTVTDKDGVWEIGFREVRPIPQLEYEFVARLRGSTRREVIVGIAAMLERFPAFSYYVQ